MNNNNYDKSDEFINVNNVSKDLISSCEKSAEEIRLEEIKKIKGKRLKKKRRKILCCYRQMANIYKCRGK